ncbi:hypothetical protein EX30DRAFT_339331 [Ascodesmis nigricans]|uniref:MFS general substrate transporter n=1 Tax=Ascodesmis nigricans TaxID=341454 RepID=A0A4S2N1T3_9PEZI|nr:hypothetical protein EX30DRAFT_339331 [Ascodesmis nigricans]
MKLFREAREGLSSFTVRERRNIAIYVCGIMLYKFGLEAFNGSIIALATNRYDYHAQQNNTTAKTFERTGLLTSLNQAFQCMGSILIAPLVKRFPTKTVLSSAILLFAVCTAILLILDASTGGTIIPDNWLKTHKKNDFSYYGTYNTDAMIPIYSAAGIVYGMVELIRRVIPRDIVGGDVKKLKRMDALVHIFYEISGTAGAFTTGLVLIPTLGNNFSFIITPCCFGCACVVWRFIDEPGFEMKNRKRERGRLEETEKVSYFWQLVIAARLFLDSVWTGMKIVFSRRRFVWLVSGYSIALYAHRFLENAICPAIAKRYLDNSAWSQIMAGGSNLGELLGALSVFLFTSLVPTPMPFLRLDAIFLFIIWYFPFWHPQPGRVIEAWRAAATLIPVSFGWAAGDVSISAYIQSSLSRFDSTSAMSENVSALGAVMAFLYTTYIVTYAITSPLLGRYLDAMYARTGGSEGGDIREGVKYIGGVQFTIVAALVLVSTMVPKGAVSWNPKALGEGNGGQKNDKEGLGDVQAGFDVEVLEGKDKGRAMNGGEMAEESK